MPTFDSQLILEFAGKPGEHATDLLGLWQVVLTDVSFSTSEDTYVPGIIWRVALPESLDVARVRLEGAGERLRTVEQHFDRAFNRLAVVAHAQSSDLEFSLPPGGAALRQPEVRLHAFLYQFVDELSFDIGGDAIAAREQMSEQFQDFARLFQDLNSYASVQTRIGNQLIGTTVVTWLGDMQIIWRAGVSLEQMRLHQQALDIALASRAKMLRMLALTMRGAALLAASIASPIGPIMTLPAAWRFINDVLAEFSQEENV